MDVSLFKKDDRAGEWLVTVRVEGTVQETVKAATEAEARAAVEEMIEDGEIELLSSDADSCRVERVRASPPMYLVLRGGEIIRSSVVMPGDEPREPTGSGF